MIRTLQLVLRKLRVLQFRSRYLIFTNKTHHKDMLLEQHNLRTRNTMRMQPNNNNNNNDMYKMYNNYFKLMPIKNLIAVPNFF